MNQSLVFHYCDTGRPFLLQKSLYFKSAISTSSVDQGFQVVTRSSIMPGGEDKQINSQTRGLSRVYSSGQRRGRGSRNRGQRSGQAVVPGSTEGLLTQNDASGSAEASSENLSQRGRGNRRGGRDARGGQEGQGTAADAPSQADALKITETPTESSSRRGQRNRRGGQQHGNRGGLIQGPSRPAAHRAFGGRLTIEPDEEHNTTPQTLSLSADAPTFVPGQPLTVRRLVDYSLEVGCDLHGLT